MSPRSYPSPYAESPADIASRKEGYRSDYHRRHSQAIKAYMEGDSTLLDEFEATDPMTQAARSRSVHFGRAVHYSRNR